MTVVEEIKAKIDIVELLSEYLQVKKSGSRFVALCPFHHEKSPSLSISPQNQFWHCFGCNEGGDIFDFVMKLDGLDFIEARDVLARKAGVEVRPEDAKRDSERRRLLSANELAAKYYNHLLVKHPAGERGRAYAGSRRLDAATIDEWGIGCAPESWDALTTFMRTRDVPERDLVAAGLALKRDRGTGVFDRFRNRLMIPIRDIQGNVVGFTGRILPSDREDRKEAKYVNTSQTGVYDKGAVVFALDKAKAEIKKKGFAVVVEGNMDAISSHQAGVKNVVASSGTAFTAVQLGLLKRFCDRLTLSFDADEAGEQAARRAIDGAVAAGFVVRILRIPAGAGKDPDDCIRKDPELWRKAITDAIPYMEWYFALAHERTDLSDAESKRRSGDSILREIAKIPDPVEQAHWVRQLAQFVATPDGMLFEKLAKLTHAPTPRQGATPTAPVTPAKAVTPPPAKAQDRVDVLSELIVGAALAWPMEVQPLLVSFQIEAFSQPYRGLYSKDGLGYDQPEHGSSREVEGQRHGEGAPARMRLIAAAERDFGDIPSEKRRSTLLALIGELEFLHKNRRTRELVAEMAKAEKAGDTRAIEAVTNELNELSA
jgi:DNA primase